MTTHREVSIHWEGDLAKGTGTVARSSSKVLDGTAFSWPSRTQDVPATSPEELIAAAHATCFAMSLAHALKQAGLVAQSLDVTCTISFGERDKKWTIVKSALDVVATVPGLDESTFARIANGAKDACPVSRSLMNNVEITIDASLSSEQLAAAAGP